MSDTVQQQWVNCQNRDQCAGVVSFLVCSMLLRIWGGGLQTKRQTKEDMERGCAKRLPSTQFEQAGCYGSWLMEEADKDGMMIRMVGGWVFLLVPAHPGSPGQRAVKRSLLLLLLSMLLKHGPSHQPADSTELQAFETRCYRTTLKVYWKNKLRRLLAIKQKDNITLSRR